MEFTLMVSRPLFFIPVEIAIFGQEMGAGLPVVLGVKSYTVTFGKKAE